MRPALSRSMHQMNHLFGCALLLSMCGCLDAEIPEFHAGTGQEDSSGPALITPDASLPTPARDASRPPRSPSDAASRDDGPEVELTHSNALLVQGSNPFTWCDRSDHHFYRSFRLRDFNVHGAFAVTSVTVGIERALAGGAGTTQPLQVTLHTVTGEMQVANLAPLVSTTVQVSDQAFSLLEVPITATVPAGATLVIEVTVPDGRQQRHVLYPGTNRLGETAPSYLRAPGCDVWNVASFAALGRKDTGLVLSVSGHER